jgi:hypothetical protein
VLQHAGKGIVYEEVALGGYVGTILYSWLFSLAKL